LCNLYSITKSQQAIRDLARAMVDTSGNVPALPAVFPDQMAPVVMTRPSDGQRELLMMRWGFPGPSSKGPPLVTNAHTTGSQYWHRICVRDFDAWCR
jgi:putative SOS response-associated peptidase YedK